MERIVLSLGLVARIQSQLLSLGHCRFASDWCFTRRVELIKARPSVMQLRDLAYISQLVDWPLLDVCVVMH